MNKKIVLGVLCASLVVTTFATENKWIEGYGQGNLEYFIDKQGIRLYISCPTKKGSADAMSSVSLLDEKTRRDVKKFIVIVNGNSYNGPFSADSRVDSDNFKSLMNDLRQADAVVKYENKVIRFPKSNAEKIVPKDGKSFMCNTFF